MLEIQELFYPRQIKENLGSAARVSQRLDCMQKKKSKGSAGQAPALDGSSRPCSRSHRVQPDR